MKKINIGWIASVMLLILSGHVVAGAGFPDLSQIGSITVTMKASDTGKSVGGGILSIYQVADAVEDDGYRLILKDDFQNSQLDVTEDAAFSKEDAAKVKNFIDQNHILGKDIEVDENGNATFPNLSCGLYLIVQKEAARGYSPVDPFLITVPTREDGVYLYNVDASPKVGLESRFEETFIQFEIKKVVEGREAPVETFSFVLKDENSAVSELLETLKIQGTGSAVSQPVVMKDEGNYIFTVQEVKGSTSGYTYDQTVYWYKVSVIESNGKLQIENVVVKKTDANGEIISDQEKSIPSVTFTNTYNPPKNPPENPPSPTVPQTGLLWWPVAAFWIIGIVILTVGMILKRHGKAR